MNIGYACKVMGDPALRQKSCTKKNATEEKLAELIAHNLDVLEKTLAYNLNNRIHLFRISSDIIPFGSSPVNTLDWKALFGERFSRLAQRARGMRLSMHPGQYTVLNSPDLQVVANAVLDLQYHADFLDCLELDQTHKLILHIGGVYGDKAAAIRRFVDNYHTLPQAIQRRLVIENDDRLYHIGDLLEISRQTGAPVVFDTLHHQVNPPQEHREVGEWLRLSGETWGPRDGRQKIHYSQQAAGKKPGSHSDTIQMPPFLALYREIGNVDVMLEVKDKNLSAIKAVNCAAPSIQGLEREWARYKYLVLEHSQREYLAIRELLKDKSPTGNTALRFYNGIREAMGQPPENAVSAAQHVWGYFKSASTEKEKERYLHLLEQCRNSGAQWSTLKRHLWHLAVKYNQPYLLQSYYFPQVLA